MEEAVFGVSRTRPTPRPPRAGAPALLLVSALAAACGGGTEPEEPFLLEAAVSELPAIPVLGTDSTLDVGTWNIEWFGDGANGPSPEGRQLDNVWTVLDATGVDLWAVQEVVRASHFNDLVTQLVGYDGLLAIDPRVADGAAYYSDFGGSEQKVGLLYRTGAVTVEEARVILGGHNDDFAGRPPVEARLAIGDPDSPLELVVIVLHAKAGAALDDRDRRARASEALEAYLDATHPGVPVLVIGDFNDDVDTSIATGRPSPYRNFVDAPGYGFPTGALSAAGERSTVSYPDMIDHHLATAALLADYVDGTAQVFRADTYLAAYPESTSDHYPVVARYSPVGGAVPFTPGDYRHATLQWTGAGSGTIDIYRDAALVATTANDGAYIDSVDPAIAAVTYRVCEAGTPRCTESATVEWAGSSPR